MKEALAAPDRPENFYNAQTWYQDKLDAVRDSIGRGEGFVPNLEDRPEIAEEIARRRMISDYTSQPRGTTMIGRATGLDAEQIRRERYAGTADRPGTKQRRAKERGRLPGVRAAKERDMMQELLRGVGEIGCACECRGIDFAGGSDGREIAVCKGSRKSSRTTNA